MRNKLIILGIFAVVSCKAQQTYPLNTFPDDVPSGSYMKDLANELAFFTGTWVTSFNGKNITLIITKQEHKMFKAPKSTDYHYQDILNVRYIVKNSNGVLLQDNNNVQNEYDKNAIISMYINNNIVNFYYTGTHCGIGWGTINLQKTNNTQISWSYEPNVTVLTTKNCPGNPDLTIYLPETKDLIFTKQ
ncbi:DUF6705 family protein [Chryseobacterium sp.]|uniref:DUF6705 family protein n=1 Tax=Chryseobacterium sp. TaxID=1871047 RepID=UPI0024E1F98B|nr:DUF6705 family protein [Chryseobacterium sp.]